MTNTSTIIRNLRGSWPQWCANLDDGRVVFVYIRYGGVRVGVEWTEQKASDVAEEVADGPEYAGVTNVLVALTVLQKQGYYYVCPTFQEEQRAHKAI